MVIQKLNYFVYWSKKKWLQKNIYYYTKCEIMENKMTYKMLSYKKMDIYLIFN